MKFFVDGFFFIGLSNIQVPDQRANCDSLDHKPQNKAFCCSEDCHDREQIYCKFRTSNFNVFVLY